LKVCCVPRKYAPKALFRYPSGELKASFVGIPS
jgi:hypothetical protein